MSVNAHISEMPGDDGSIGAYYEVRLEYIPRVGETIDLYSNTDAASGHEPRHLYEVVGVEHKLSDIPRGSDKNLASQFVIIRVTPAARVKG